MAGSAGTSFVPPSSPTALGSLFGALQCGQAWRWRGSTARSCAQGTFVASSRASTPPPASRSRTRATPKTASVSRGSRIRATGPSPPHRSSTQRKSPCRPRSSSSSASTSGPTTAPTGLAGEEGPRPDGQGGQVFDRPRLPDDSPDQGPIRGAEDAQEGQGRHAGLEVVVDLVEERPWPRGSARRRVPGPTGGPG